MTLKGIQHEKLSEALRDAFRSPQRFNEFVKFRFDRNLYDITIAEDLRQMAFNLINEADREGWIEQLIVEARQSNPKNLLLLAFAQEFNLATPIPPELSGLKLEKIIKKTNSFLDVNQWREQLGQIEMQICRIEITTNQNFGTGFLIAPNVVMTNFHVIESVILGQAASNRVILRFDYKRLTDGKIINKGTEYHLTEEDWLIDSSPYVKEQNRLPPPDELDYALLRLNETPGQEPIGNNPERDSSKRGWIKLTTEPYNFLPNTPLFILQHPQASPLKLALDTEAIIGVNENGTTVTYKTNTEDGSSGSPCFDINWNLVALHHSGDPIWQNPTYNAGTPISAICSCLKKKDLLKYLLNGEPFKIGQYFDQQDRLPELFEKACEESNNAKLNQKNKNLIPNISEQSSKIYKLPISKEVQQLDKTDIINLESFIKKSGKATKHNARIVLCNKVGVDPDDIDFAEQISVKDFANLLIKYLVDIGNFDGLLQLCKEIKQNFNGILLTQIEKIEAKIKIIKASQ